MDNLYQGYKCKMCKREMVLIKENVDTSIKHGNYLACAYCGSKVLVKTKSTDDLREIIKSRSYKRNSRGAIEEIT